MSTYKKISEAVETAIFHLQIPTAEGIARYVAKNLGLKNVGVREIDKMIHEVATQYKKAKDEKVSG